MKYGCFVYCIGDSFRRKVIGTSPQDALQRVKENLALLEDTPVVIESECSFDGVTSWRQDQLAYKGE